MALPLPTYATPDDLEDYSEAFVVDNEDAANRLMYRAQQQVDQLLVGRVGAIQATGLRYDPDALEPWVAQALKNAVCAQAEYRLAMGEDFLIRDQRQQEQTPDMTLIGKVGRIAPKVYEELAGTGLLRFGARLSRSGATWTPPWPYPYQA
jgi:hypothetical protein